MDCQPPITTKWEAAGRQSAGRPSDTWCFQFPTTTVQLCRASNPNCCHNGAVFRWLLWLRREFRRSTNLWFDPRLLPSAWRRSCPRARQWNPRRTWRLCWQGVNRTRDREVQWRRFIYSLRPLKCNINAVCSVFSETAELKNTFQPPTRLKFWSPSCLPASAQQ